MSVFFFYLEDLFPLPIMPSCIHKLSVYRDTHIFPQKSLILEFEIYEIDKVGNFSHLAEFTQYVLTLFLVQQKRD